MGGPWNFPWWSFGIFGVWLSNFNRQIPGCFIQLGTCCSFTWRNLHQNGYPAQGTRKHIPPNGMLGKSSTQKVPFTVADMLPGGYSPRIGPFITRLTRSLRDKLSNVTNYPNNIGSLSLDIHCHLLSFGTTGPPKIHWSVQGGPPTTYKWGYKPHK